MRGGYMNKKRFVDPRFAKNKEYAKTINEILKAGHCPFCPKNFRYHKRPILKRNGKWMITGSSHPYKNSQHHFLILGEKHYESFLDLRPNDFASIQKLVRYAVKKFNLQGAGLLVRFGDTRYTGATVSHLHFHLVVPKMRKGKSVAVNFPIG
jgi:ATP adenylyltransferase